MIDKLNTGKEGEEKLEKIATICSLNDNPDRDDSIVNNYLALNKNLINN
jgi:hypothetical protein